MLKTAIHLMKFEKMKRLARPLGKLLSSVQLPGADAIIPVPLSKERLILRGFNQSHLLGRYLSKKLSIPVKYNLLIKTKDIQPQSVLSREERVKNPRGSFAVARISRKEIPKSVLIVDDVMTTGATMNECARTLKKKGVRTVYGVVVARTRAD